jgi:hypothetical protein
VGGEVREVTGQILQGLVGHHEDLVLPVEQGDGGWDWVGCGGGVCRPILDLCCP